MSDSKRGPRKNKAAEAPAQQASYDPAALLCKFSQFSQLVLHFPQTHLENIQVHI